MSTDPIKPGYKTTEFWGTIVFHLANIALFVLGTIDATWAVTASGIGAVDAELARSGQTKPEETSGSERKVIDAAEAEERLMDLLRRLMAEVVSQKNPKLTVECLGIACGLNPVDGDSMQEVARRRGISRAAVSKRVVDIAEKLNLPPSRAMRSKAARKTYRQVQKALRSRHERTRHRKP